VRGYAINWRGNGLDEVGYCTKSGRVLIKVHERYFRPTEVDFLLGDSTKAKRELGWSPTTGFDQFVKEMVDADCC